MNKNELHSSNMVEFDISYKAQNCKEAPLLQKGIKKHALTDSDSNDAHIYMKDKNRDSLT